MGLDMYLSGTRFIHNRRDTKHPIVEERCRLGYWRKHPSLHGYIVNTFAGGDDDCQPIPLEREDILQILEAVKAERLPFTSGFFFGESDGTEKDADIEIFTEALTWLDASDENAWRSIIYQASW